MRVLLVEESAAIRARLAERFAAVLVDVREAADLDAALSAAHARAPDAIVVGLYLDGRATTLALSELRRVAPAALIVVLTNQIDALHRQECLRHGADVFLDKSREFDLVVDLVRAATLPRAPRDASS